MGCIHIYTGDGKGKTTAAMGLAMRSVGWGKRVLVVQFLKGGITGELATLEALEIPVRRNKKDYGFFVALDEPDRKTLLAEQNAMLADAASYIRKNRYDLVVLDELNCAYNLGAVDRESADDLVLGGPYETELVLTGRDVPASWIEAADYVTEMTEGKHPYSWGAEARKGIEY